MMTTLTLQSVDTGETLQVFVAEESVHVDAAGHATSFLAFIGNNANHEPLYIPYVLSDDRHPGRKQAIHATLETLRVLRVTVRAGKSYVDNANELKALREGPDAMHARGLKGARSGLMYGLLYFGLGEIRRHIKKSTERNHDHYYISPSGPDFYGPVAG